MGKISLDEWPDGSEEVLETDEGSTLEVGRISGFGRGLRKCMYLPDDEAWKSSLQSPITGPGRLGRQEQMLKS